MKYFKYMPALGALLLTSVASGAVTEEWMSGLPDNVAVRELSIPGAHDAATGNGFSGSSSFLALFSGVTQSLSLEAQWDAGVRAFDLRPSYKAGVDGNLQIYHGILETKMSMKAALQTLVDKLASSPGEMAVVLMRHESDSDSNSDSWPAAMSELLAEFDGHIATFSPDMTLGDARGKIIVLSRDSFESAKAAMIAGWSHSESFTDQKRAILSLGRNKAALYAQDYYECSSADSKYQAVTTLIDYSTANTSTTPWVINHVSGYTGSGTNSDVSNLAKALNMRVADYLEASEPGRAGILMMDFAGATNETSGKALVDKIIAQNARYMDVKYAAVDAPESASDIAGDDRVYDLRGRYLGRGAEILKDLPAGVYIHNGVKIIIR